MNEFKFGLNDCVKISVSGECGVIRARAEYVHCENSYLLCYKAGDGRATEAWWAESQIEEDEQGALARNPDFK